MRLCAPALAVALAISSDPAPGQWIEASAGVRTVSYPQQPPLGPDPNGSDGLFPSADSARRPSGRWWVVASSAVLPGSGQFALGQRRFLVYAGVEAVALLQYFSHRHRGRGERVRYREIARETARAAYGGESSPGDFGYYERMRNYVASGAFDRIPGGDIDPEMDEITFNGAIWSLARQTFWTDPDMPPDATEPAYQNAIAFYERRAVKPIYEWSWEGADGEYSDYKRALSSSNDAFRASASYLGVLIANHVLSAVDASVAVSMHRASDGSVLVGATLPLPRSLVAGAR